MRAVFVFASIAAAILACVRCASAESLFIQFSTPYTSSVVPAPGGGGPPYMTTLFEDIVGQPGKVRLTLSTFGLTAPNEFVAAWYFNLDPVMDVSLLSFTFDASATTAVTKSNYSFVKNENDLDLGGQAVGFDFGPKFGTSNSSDKRFSADELFVGTIQSSQPGLSANSFRYLNAGDGQNDVFFYGIAKVQGIAPGDQSTKLGGEIVLIPLPVAAWAGVALMGMIGLKRLLQRRPCE